MIDDIQQRRKTSVVVEPPFVLRAHKQAALADEEGGQILRFVDAVGATVGLEAVNPDLFGLVQIPARLGPERLDVAVIAARSADKERVAAPGRLRIEIFSRLRLRRGD